MRTMRGLITQVERHQGRIGRVWRRISQPAAPLLLKRRASAQRSLMRCAPGMTGKTRMGEVTHRNTSLLHRKRGAQ